MEPYDSAYVPSPLGFYNTGSNCWLNALLQGLLSCPTFARTVLGAKDELARTPLGATLHALVRDALAGAPVSDRSGEVCRILTECKQFGFGQEGADEGLHMIMDVLRSESLNKVLMHRYRVGRVCPPCRRVVEDAKTPNTGYTIKMFHYKGDDFMGSLSTQVDELDHLNFRCDTCSGKLCNVYVLTMLPEIVIVLFNKYYNKHLIAFPQSFTLDGVGGKKLLFEQVAQVEHSGTRSGGHYWALCRRGGGVYSLNDRECTPVAGFAPTANTYMVFYSYIKEV